MSYTPPLGNAVDFTTQGAPFSPTPAGAVNFIEYGWTVRLSGTGAVAFGGALAANVGVGLTASGAVVLGGQAAVFAEVKLSANSPLVLSGSAAAYVAPFISGSGQILADGFLDIDAQPPSFSVKGRGAIDLGGIMYDTGYLAYVQKPIRLSGNGTVAHGVSGHGVGTIMLSGSLQGRRGGSVSVSAGRISLGGTAVGNHGAGSYASGKVALLGTAFVSVSAGVHVTAAGAILLGGYMNAESPLPDFVEQQVFVRHSIRRIHVLQ